MSRPLIVAVTGAGGYAGSAIVQAIEQGGHSVVELVRRPIPGSTRRQIPFDLSAETDPATLRAEGVDTLVHVAWDFRPRTLEEIRRVNLQGAIRLFDAFRSISNGTGLFLSTIAAYDNSRSFYGQVKRETEHEAMARGFWVVRPGLIQGGEPGGIVGTMLKLVRKLPVVPILGYGKRVLHPIAAEVLASRVARLIEAPPMGQASALVVAARRERLSLDDLVRSMIREYKIGPRLLIPIPWQPAWLALRAAERLGLPISLRSDSIISLMNQDPDPPFSDP